MAEIVSTRKYLVVLTAESALYFGEDDFLKLKNFPSIEGRVDVKIYTARVRSEEFSRPLRDGLRIECLVSTGDFYEAIDGMGNLARGLAAILATVENAAVDDPTAWFAREVTPDATSRRYWQRYLESAPDIAIGRRADSGLLDHVIRHWVEHPEWDRLLRAFTQYQRFLQDLSPGNEIASAAQLWRVVESLTPVVRQVELALRGIAASALREIWYNELPAFGRPQFQNFHLDPEIRRRLIFKSDNEAYGAAKDARNGYEHSSRPYHEVREYAVRAMERSPALIRASLFEQLGLDNEALDLLQIGSRAVPSAFGVWHSVEANLFGSAKELDELPCDPQFYWWQEYLEGPSANDGDSSIIVGEHIEPLLPEGITFEAKGSSLATNSPDETFKFYRRSDDGGGFVEVEES